jgi:3-dehydroquinate dehydratase-2
MPAKKTKKLSTRAKRRPGLRILIASGVNLDLLGKREPEIYGYETLTDMQGLVRKNFKQADLDGCYEAHVKLSFFQTNDEAKFLAELSKSYDGAVINAGAWTHTSLAIADRLAGLGLKFVEVHVSDLSRRESFRQQSFMAVHAIEVISGLGISGYWRALEVLLAKLIVRT